MHYFSSQVLTFISFSIILLLGDISEVNSIATPTPQEDDSGGSLSDKTISPKNKETFNHTSSASHINTSIPQTNNMTPQASDSAPQSSNSAPQTSDPTQQTGDSAPQTSDSPPQTSDLQPPEDPKVIQWLDAISWSSEECKHAVRERYATTEFSELNCGSVYLFNIHAADYFTCAEDEKCQMLKHFCKKSPEAEDLLIKDEIQKCSGKPQS